jgi:hypothetical protein
MPSAPKKGKKIKIGGAEDIDAKNERLEALKQQYEQRETAIAKEAYLEAREKEKTENEYERQEEADRKWADEQKRIQVNRDKQNRFIDENRIKTELQQANTIEDTIKKKLEQTNVISKTGLQNLQSKNTISKTILQDAQTVETNSKDTLNRATTRNTNSKTTLQNTQKSHANQENTRKNIKFTSEGLVNIYQRIIWKPLVAIGHLLVKIGQFIRRAWPYLKQLVLALFHFLFNHRMSAFAPYFTLFLVICLILGLIGFVALASSNPPPEDKEKENEGEPPAPPIEDTEEGPMWVLPDGVRMPVIDGQLPPMPTVKKPGWFSMPSFSLPSMPRFITDGFDRLVPTYKASMIAQSLAPYTSPIHVPELQTTPREKIVGRCDNLKYMETSLKSGEGGMCTTTDVPTPITWVMDVTKSDDYKNLPDQIKKRIGTDGSKNKITIPWKSDGFVYSPDCEKATFADGTSANLYNDHGEYCKKKEVDKIKYKDAWRIKKQFSYYKGIDAFE